MFVIFKPPSKFGIEFGNNLLEAYSSIAFCNLSDRVSPCQLITMPDIQRKDNKDVFVVKTVSHIAFKMENLDETLKNFDF